MITRSSVHAALGETAALSFTMVERAVAEKVAEDEGLDWKGVLPVDGDELAKDVAAFANSRGGLIVYGVVEDRATAQASRINLVDISDHQQRRIRSWIQTRIRPAVPAVDVLALPASDRPDEGLLVLHVPESPDMPHLVGSSEKLGAPYRVGRQTFWMGERELERAYSDRFTRREADETRLARMIEHLEEQLDLDTDAWILGVASPTVAAPLTARTRNRSGAVDALAAAVIASERILAKGDGREVFLGSMGDAANNPRVGLRRWVARTTQSDAGPEARSTLVHVELHHDGSVAIAVRVEGWYNVVVDGKHSLPYWVLNGFVADFVGLTRAAANMSDVTGSVLLRIALLRRDERPFALLIREDVGQVTVGVHQPVWSRDVRRFTPIDGVLNDMEGDSEVARLLAVDVASQFGIPEEHLRW